MRKNNPRDFNRRSSRERRQLHYEKSRTRHYRPDEPDYGLRFGRIRTPSSGFSYSEAQEHEAQQFMNPNVDYVPEEPVRDTTGYWTYSALPELGQNRRREERHRFYRPTLDDEITAYVHEVLYRHPDIDVSQIQIETHSGIVTLRGLVETWRMKRLIEDTIFGVPEVFDIQNQIEVQRSDPDRWRL